MDEHKTDLSDLQYKFEEMKKENKKLLKVIISLLNLKIQFWTLKGIKIQESSESTQLLEQERNIKTKNEIDYQYMVSLRYTVSIYLI